MAAVAMVDAKNDQVAIQEPLAMIEDVMIAVDVMTVHQEVPLIVGQEAPKDPEATLNAAMHPDPPAVPRANSNDSASKLAESTA
jgi:hypothetical protein